MMKLALAAARATAFASRASGRGGGTTLPGRVLTALAPDAPRQLAARLPRGCVLVSATNGKTTTCALLAEVLRGRVRLARNSAGANLASGIASALAEREAAAAELGLFECDEAALPAIAAQLDPQRDRARQPLPRPARPLRRARARGRALARPRREPLRRRRRSSCRRRRPADRRRSSRVTRRVVRYGIDDPSVALAVAPHAADARFCVRCGHAYDYRAAYVGHLSDYSCPNCGNARAPLDVAARAIDLHGLDGTVLRPLPRRASACASSSRCPGLYNVENALAAAALAGVLGEPLTVIAEGLARFRGAFGRFQRLRVGDRRPRAAADQEPGRRQRGAAHPAGRRRPDAVRAQRPHRRRPRRLVDLGRRLGADRRPALRHVVCSRARARATRRCGSSTPASTPRRSRSCPTSPHALDRLAELSAGRQRLRAADLHGDARAAAHRRPPRPRRSRTGRRRRHEARALPAVSRAPLDLRRPRQRPGHPPAARVARARARGAAAARRRGARPRGRRPVPHRRRPGPRPAARRRGPAAPPRGDCTRPSPAARRCSPCAAATSSPGTATSDRTAARCRASACSTSRRSPGRRA